MTVEEVQEQARGCLCKKYMLINKQDKSSCYEIPLLKFQAD